MTLVALAAPGQAAAQDVPTPTPATVEGNGGRFLMSGDGWFFRRNANPSFSAVSVPHAWNAGDDSAASMGGGVVWYRKDFRVPDRSRSYDWTIRFESVRYRATVWLNGRRIGAHAGAYLPWELRLPNISRGGTNRLLIRVDNRRRETDLPPSRVTVEGVPGGGWWNYGGILGHVYLRRVNRLDFRNVEVRPDLPCRNCAAAIHFRATVRNQRAGARRVRVRGRFGDQSVNLGSRTIRGFGEATFTGRITVEAPHLWSPPDPFLYPVQLEASGGGAASYDLLSGIRSFTVANGRLELNHMPVSFRGGFFHEDAPGTGGALGQEQVDELITQAKGLGITALRSHYPLSPYLHEQADRQGLLVWSEIPAYQLPSSTLKKTSVRRLAGRMLRQNIRANGNHASIFTWSIGNELRAEPSYIEAAYFDQVIPVARSLDPTRPVSLAIQAYPGAGCQPDYGKFDLLGFNTYFGWYPGPNGSTADRTLLSGYLDQIRNCYPGQAIAVTEFGAEANRSGPAEIRGTYEFQQEWLEYTLPVLASKPWLSGQMAMMREFRVRPGWSGGNPRATPPMHQKGVLDYFGNPKPGAAVLERWFREAQQYDLPAARQ